MSRCATFTIDFQENGWLDWDPETRTYTAQMSDLGLHKIPGTITVRNHLSGGITMFSNPRAEKNRELAVASWLYEGEGGAKLLIINEGGEA